VGGERCGVGDRDGGGDGDSDSDRDRGGGPGPLVARARTESGMGQAPGNREDGIEQGRAGVTVAWSTSPQAMATARCERSSPAEPAAIR